MFPSAPLAIAILLVIKIGWINKREKLKKEETAACFFFLTVKND
jgi:hypothetical protein